MARLILQGPGEPCSNTEPGEHQLLASADDAELQSVASWLSSHPVADAYTEAIRNSIDYVLDGGRTGRFDLMSPEVHPGERASVGAKLEYEILRILGLPKTRPLDTLIADVPVDIKVTVGDNWAIPTEAHCQLCICTQIQLKKNRHRSWLVRAHRSWLYRGKGNKDQKRGLAVQAREQWSLPLYDWAELPVNPLRYLTEEQVSQVLAKKPGQVRRMLKMFHFLEGHIIPRNVFLTVGSGKQDPMRRARQLRDLAAKEGLTVLCGTWVDSRDQAAARGITLQPGEWIALRDGAGQDGEEAPSA
ncbi:NaeI family type II restriction endonuclease [Streptomyces aureocirculatus]|uniref:NaeI family type II restriction endonuclease n=1 Tax=Streptomyces aureocirculatus TaxID=67275 RepID=UPI00099C1161|nr:NaeI family type II restriction endonuclease [Streptomyces aureocirculatus]